MAIDAKEGVIDAIREKIGSSITDSVLETSGGTESKSVDEIELHTVLDATEHHAASDARDELKAFVATRFDYGGKLVNIVKQLKVKVNKVKGYGVNLQDDVIVLIIMANVEWVKLGHGGV